MIPLTHFINSNCHFMFTVLLSVLHYNELNSLNYANERWQATDGSIWTLIDCFLWIYATNHVEFRSMCFFRFDLADKRFQWKLLIMFGRNHISDETKAVCNLSQHFKHIVKQSSSNDDYFKHVFFIIISSFYDFILIEIGPVYGVFLFFFNY